MVGVLVVGECQRVGRTCCLNFQGWTLQPRRLPSTCSCCENLRSHLCFIVALYNAMLIRIGHGEHSLSCLRNETRFTDVMFYVGCTEDIFKLLKYVKRKHGLSVGHCLMGKRRIWPTDRGFVSWVTRCDNWVEFDCVGICLSSFLHKITGKLRRYYVVFSSTNHGKRKFMVNTRNIWSKRGTGSYENKESRCSSVLRTYMRKDDPRKFFEPIIERIMWKIRSNWERRCMYQESGLCWNVKKSRWRWLNHFHRMHKEDRNGTGRKSWRRKTKEIVVRRRPGQND